MTLSRIITIQFYTTNTNQTRPNQTEVCCAFIMKNNPSPVSQNKQEQSTVALLMKDDEIIGDLKQKQRCLHVVWKNTNDVCRARHPLLLSCFYIPALLMSELFTVPAVSRVKTTRWQRVLHGNISICVPSILWQPLLIITHSRMTFKNTNACDPVSITNIVVVAETHLKHIF